MLPLTWTSLWTNTQTVNIHSLYTQAVFQASQSKTQIAKAIYAAAHVFLFTAGFIYTCTRGSLLSCQVFSFPAQSPEYYFYSPIYRLNACSLGRHYRCLLFYCYPEFSALSCWSVMIKIVSQWESMKGCGLALRETCVFGATFNLLDVVPGVGNNTPLCHCLCCHLSCLSLFFLLILFWRFSACVCIMFVPVLSC